MDATVQITTASDIFQFGTVFYELLTGFNPQRRPAHVTDPIQLDLRDIRGSQGPRLTQPFAACLLRRQGIGRLPINACCGSIWRIGTIARRCSK